MVEGFKHTEVGLIPEDWDLIPYGEVFDFYPTATYSRADLSENNEIGYVHYGDIHVKCQHFLDLDKISLPTINKSQLSNYALLKDGDVIVVDASEDYVGVGKSVEVRNLGEQKAISGLHTFLLRDNKAKISNGFKGFIHSNELVKKQLDTLATGLKVYGVSKNNLKTVLIPLPPTKSEQTAIATALNDADALINALEKLIAKKKAIQQGAMQKLLKPKDGWIEQKLECIIDSFIDYRGVTPKKLGMEWGNGYIPALSANNVQMGFIDFKKECYFGSENLYKRWMRNGDCEMNDIVITMEAPLGNIAQIPDSKKYILSQRTVLLKPKNFMDKTFLKFYMMHSDFQNQLLDHASGSTAKGIKRKTLETLFVAYPKEKLEQIRISRVLIDLNSEIEALQQKLEKQKQIKQGMMQVLLTGKIRLM